MQNFAAVSLIEWIGILTTEKPDSIAGTRKQEKSWEMMGNDGKLGKRREFQTKHESEESQESCVVTILSKFF